MAFLSRGFLRQFSTNSFAQVPAFKARGVMFLKKEKSGVMFLWHFRVFKKLNVKVKIRLYKSAVCSIVRYGSDGYSLDATARRRLKDFNAKRLAVITGRSIEAENRNPSYDLVNDVRLARLKWLGHILRLDENITLHKTIKDLYTNGIHHDGMLMDEAPNSKDFEELVEIARERSRWREFAKEKCSKQFNPARTRAPIGEPNLTEERGGNRVGTRDRTLFKAHTHNVPKVMNKN